MKIMSLLVRPRPAASSTHLASLQRIVATSEAECLWLHDYALESDDRADACIAFARQQEDEIARLYTDFVIASTGMEALKQECDRLSDDLDLAYQTRDGAMEAVGRQKIEYEAQLRGRDERIAELEVRLAAKRMRKPKAEPTEAVGSETKTPFIAGVPVRIVETCKEPQYRGKTGILADVNTFRSDAAFFAVRVDGAILNFGRNELEALVDGRMAAESEVRRG